MLTILNNPPAHITDGQERYWEFILANPHFEAEEEPIPDYHDLFFPIDPIGSDLF